MKQSFLLSWSFVALSICCMAKTTTQPPKLVFTTDNSTGGISSLSVEGDKHDMNWLVATDGTQYGWCDSRFMWGLGYFDANGVHDKWEKATTTQGKSIIYKSKTGITIIVERAMIHGDLQERYTFRNTSDKEIALDNIGIFTPWNDNYPNSKECIPRRANVHIWDGLSAAYVCAIRMGADAPHLGLKLNEGSIIGYDVWERAMNRESSHMRGIFAMRIEPFTLLPKQEHIISWSIFIHNGYKDFENSVISKGGIIASSDKYTLESGETAHITVKGNIGSCSPSFEGKTLKAKHNKGEWTFDVTVNRMGENVVDIDYGKGKKTWIKLNCISSYEKMISKRKDFILEHQQMNNPYDLRNGAYMIYDNEGDSIYPNDTPNCNPVDRDEGAERMGMGIFLAKYCQLYPDDKIKASLIRYAQFIREALQKPDFTTYSSVDQTNRNRGYNYPWTAEYYFHMYRLTGNKKYAEYGFNTMQALYRHFGYGFYTIGTPITLGLAVLKEAGMNSERQKLLEDYMKTADIYMNNGVYYPVSEVNYEQSIVGPSVQLLLEMYIATGNEKYLNSAKLQLPVLEAFNGHQPSYHLNDIAIRHWDGYWFGKREMFGDTFPQYWSCITSAVFHYYAQITGDESYQVRAQNIVLNNMCNFEENGRAHCAYLYPMRVNGQTGQFYEPYANDQDWVLTYYYLIHNNL